MSRLVLEHEVGGGEAVVVGPDEAAFAALADHADELGDDAPARAVGGRGGRGVHGDEEVLAPGVLLVLLHGAAVVAAALGQDEEARAGGEVVESTF